VRAFDRMTTTAPIAASERRATNDRRRHPTPMLSRYWLRGRRRGGRRDGETQRIYVDRYTSVEVALAAAVLVLALADVALTAIHLAHGGEELNPLLAAVLERAGVAGLAAVRMAVSGLALAVLLLHVRWPLARHGLVGLCTLHVALLGWHAVVAFDRTIV